MLMTWLNHIDTFNEECKMFYDTAGQPKTFFLARGRRDKMPSLNYSNFVYNVKDWYNIKENLL